MYVSEDNMYLIIRENSFSKFVVIFSVQLYTIHPGVESNPNVGITTFQTAIVRKGELNNLERLEKSRFLKTN